MWTVWMGGAGLRMVSRVSVEGAGLKTERD